MLLSCCPPILHLHTCSGQRKRVTTGEILCGPASAILFDEISTGLDSATTYSVVQSFWHVAHAMRRTFVSWRGRQASGCGAWGFRKLLLGGSRGKQGAAVPGDSLALQA